MKNSLHTNIKLYLLILPLLLFFASVSLAQEISGTVVDAGSSETLPGVNILVKGTTIGTSTDAEGNYNLSVPSLQDTLIFSYIGYESKQIAIDGRTELDLSLQLSTFSSGELVVVGYGTQKSENLTGSVASVSSDEMAKLPVPSVTHALQGMAPGLQILDGGGRPGRDNLDVLIRGQGTLGRGANSGDAGASRPLVLIDGVEGDLSNVNINDVENISVLKDASSAAIYGSRAANGVILVTTKRGEENPGTQISYNGYVGMQNITAWPERVSTVNHMRLANLARSNYMQWCLDGRNPNVPVSECESYDSYQPRYTEEYIQNTIAGTDPDAYPDNEWVDAMFDPAPIQDHSLRISGGSSTAQYSLSMNYMNEEGLMPNTSAKGYGVRLNTNFQATEKISGGLDISANRQWDIIPSLNNDATFNLIHDTPPTHRTRFSDGTYGLNLFGKSPLAYAEISGDEQRVFWEGKVTGRLNYEIVPGWAEIRTLASYDYGSMDWERFVTDPNYIDEYPDDASYWGPNYGENRSNKDLGTTLQAILDFNHDFNETHDISGLIGYEQIHNEFDEFRASRDQFYNNQLRQLDLGNTANDGTAGFANEWSLRSVFSRLNYELNDRYLFEFNARYDGSSRFAEGHRYGFFPSFSAGWRVSEESFFNINWVDEFKLRGSWGQLGNQSVPLYSYYSSINLGISYYMGNSAGAQAVGGAATDLVNNQLSWETTTVKNVGFDATLLDGRLNLTGDVYNRYTDDILLGLPIPDLVGLDAPYQNAGAVENRGWELSVAWQDNVGAVSYGIDFNLSDNRNEVVDLKDTGPYIEGERINQVGSPINSWYGWETEGLFNSYEQIDAHAQPAGQETHLGDIIFKDQNDDGIINDADRVVIGDPNPRYIFGVNLNLGWKNIDFSALIQGVGKRDQYLSLGFIQGPVWENYTSQWHNDYWTPDNQDARHPAYYSNYNRNYYATNDWWILDGSFVKLRNLQVGYTLPNKVLTQIGIQRLRVYATGKNLWTHQNMGIGLDPEYPSMNNTRGNYYPQTRVISLGANISF